MNKTAIIVVIIIILAILGFVFLGNNEDTPSDTNGDANPAGTYEEGSEDAGTNDTPDASISTDASVSVGTGKTHTIEFNGDAYSPKEITVKAGDTVMWKNTGSEDMWPASAMHPTHTVYPGSSITKCGTADEKNIFDACRAIKAGASYSFMFTQKGSWGYHDHLNASLFGKVVVE